MSVEVRSFAPTVPAGTAQSAGWSADLSFPPRIVEGVDIRVPPGPRGNVGFYIGSAGTPIIPTNTGEWIITDDEKISFDLEDQITSGAWTFYAYNNGALPHTIYVRFRLALTVAASVAPGVSLFHPSTMPIGAS